MRTALLALGAILSSITNLPMHILSKKQRGYSLTQLTKTFKKKPNVVIVKGDKKNEQQN